MLCEICGKSQATVHYTEIISNEMAEIHLCENCAREKGALIKPQFPLADLLAGLADFQIPSMVEEGKVGKCSRCGLTYAGFRKGGQLGCSQCYYAFKDGLALLLKRVHGASKHVGKIPALANKEIKDGHALKELRERLSQAVQKEEFEEAARWRDRIKELEKDSD